MEPRLRLPKRHHLYENVLGTLTTANLNRSWTGYLGAAGIALVLALTALEPVASQGLSTFQRVIFWAPHVALGLPFLSVSQLVVTESRLSASLHPWLQVTLAGLLGALLFAPVALGLDAMFVSAGFEFGPPDDTRLHVALLEEAGSVIAPMTLIWMLVNAPRLLNFDAASGAEPKEAEATGAAATLSETDEPADQGAAVLQELWDRLPPRLGRDLVAITAELHYLRVYTTRGDDLILMGFGRAVEALEAHGGFRIHRSHWVSLRHVADLKVREGRASCELDTGLKLPVSRANRADFKAALRAWARGEAPSV